MSPQETKQLFVSLESRLSRTELVRLNGRVVQVVGLVIESQGPDIQVGDLCEVRFRNRPTVLRAEVVGFRSDRVLLMPLGELSDIGPGCDVVAMGPTLGVHVGDSLLGRCPGLGCRAPLGLGNNRRKNPGNKKADKMRVTPASSFIYGADSSCETAPLFLARSIFNHKITVII